MNKIIKTETYLFGGLSCMAPLCIWELRDYFWYLFILSLFGLSLIFYGISRCDNNN